MRLCNFVSRAPSIIDEHSTAMTQAVIVVILMQPLLYLVHMSKTKKHFRQTKFSSRELQVGFASAVGRTQRKLRITATEQPCAGVLIQRGNARYAIVRRSESSVPSASSSSFPRREMSTRNKRDREA